MERRLPSHRTGWTLGGASGFGRSHHVFGQRILKFCDWTKLACQRGVDFALMRSARLNDRLASRK